MLNFAELIENANRTPGERPSNFLQGDCFIWQGTLVKIMRRTFARYLVQRVNEDGTLAPAVPLTMPQDEAKNVWVRRASASQVALFLAQAAAAGSSDYLQEGERASAPKVKPFTVAAIDARAELEDAYMLVIKNLQARGEDRSMIRWLQTILEKEERGE